MKLIHILYFLYSLASSLALYPAPNYESVVTKTPRTTTVPPTPAIEYEIPKEYQRYIPPKQPEVEYGVPNVKVPATIYGVPTRTFDFDLSDLTGDTNTEKVPQVPATSYGVPVQKVKVPESKIITYVVPYTFDFDLIDEETDEGKPSNTYEVPKPQRPSTTYGVPFKPPTPFRTTYGVPTTSKPTAPSVEYGVPQDSVVISRKKADWLRVPAGYYELPSVRYQVPSTEYGVPKVKPSEEYGLPKVRPSEEYGLPKVRPSEEYGLPKVKVPDTVYGLF